MRIEDRYVEVCKGHLFNRGRCLTCHISKRNRKEICYKPVLLNRDYQGQSALNVIRHSLEDTHALSGEEGGMRGEPNLPLFSSPLTNSQQTKHHDISMTAKVVIKDDKTADTYSQQTKSNIPYGDGTTVRNDGSVGNKTADTYSDDEGTYFKRFELEEEA